MLAVHASRFTAVIDRFQPPSVPAPDNPFQVRFLAGGALLGIAVAVPAAATSFVTQQFLATWLIGVFAAGQCATLMCLRRGVPTSRLLPVTLIFLGLFFTAASLTTAEMRWEQLKWFALLPLVSLAARGTRPGAAPTRSTLGGSTLLALALGAFVVAAHRFGWTADEPGVALGAVDTASYLLDFVLFTSSAGSLLWIHQAALARTEEELALLRSMLAVCAWCKRIRDDEAGWIDMDHYLAHRSHLQLTHGICPECEQSLWAAGTT